MTATSAAQPRIRPATECDAGAIARVQVHGWQWAYQGQLPQPFLDSLATTVERRTEAWRRMVQHAASRREHIYVAEQSGIVRGFVSTGPARDSDADAAAALGEIYAIYVEQAVAGTGLGYCLFQQAVTALRQDGWTTAVLWVLETNARARRFYERAGWLPDGVTRTEERPDCTLREVRYGAPLI